MKNRAFHTPTTIYNTISTSSGFGFSILVHVHELHLTRLTQIPPPNLSYINISKLTWNKPLLKLFSQSLTLTLYTLFEAPPKYIYTRRERERERVQTCRTYVDMKIVFAKLWVCERSYFGWFFFLNIVILLYIFVHRALYLIDCDHLHTHTHTHIYILYIYIYYNIYNVGYIYE